MVAIPYLWLLVLFLVPFLIVFKISFSLTAVAQPPYTPVLSLADGWQGLVEAFREFTIDNYLWLTEDALYLNAYLSSLWIALVSTVLTLLIGYPIAYGMARAPKTWQADAGDARHPAVLDLVPDPRLRLDRHPEEGGPAQPVPRMDRR